MNDYKYYAEKVSSLKANTAQNILTIGLFVSEAKSKLSDDDFKSFLDSTHYTDKSSSVRKWIQIGKAYQRLNPIASKLPVAWSTIYKLSNLAADKFDLLERRNVLNATVTAREIDECLSVKNPANAKKIQITIKFDLSTDPLTFKKTHDLISKSLPNSLSQMILTEEAEALLNAANSSASILKQAA